MYSIAQLPPDAAEAIRARPYWSPTNLAVFLAVSRRTIWAMVARRQLPRPLKISGNVVRWPAAVIEAFLYGVATDQPHASDRRQSTERT